MVPPLREPANTLVPSALLDNNQMGLDQDGFLELHFQGSPPVSQSDRDTWWEEFKRACEYSNRSFDRGVPPWAMIRARPGHRRGQYFYHVVARLDGDRIIPEGDPATMDLLEDFTDRRWHTQTKSRQRVRVAEAFSLIDRGRATNNQGLVDRGEQLLNQFVILSPGLAAVNFDAGLVMDDLQQLAHSRDPHIRLLNSQIRNALRSGRRFQRDVDQIVHSVLALKDIYSQGSMKALP